MKINEAIEIIKEYVDLPMVCFQINKNIFENSTGREMYNQIIRQNVEQKHGIYIWINNENEEIMYIGMAGTLKTDGTFGDHTIQNRLMASRGKDKESGKDIQTNDYIKNIMKNNNIGILDFCIIYSKKDELPAYIEALLLNKYYKQNKRLPKLNNSF